MTLYTTVLRGQVYIYQKINQKEQVLFNAAPQLLEACKALVKAATTISHRRIEECPADLGEAECVCGFHTAVDAARATIATVGEE